ncbi:timeless-domain-containing protein [Trichocladium antarcticum]|uniref:Topoisomerase 1-associated factor 1 n=1 Tax=Trichocladium antarcticum TaxID=1450529 RepID=A0AAN6URC6_9PEZI|nr:timeless-domain-containing protein [Trichocladium antarcticum]
MEDAEANNDTVHPQVRAHINSLVSALGGTGIDDDGGYTPGDDALEVLRDIKKWIRFYDEKTNRMDVARCLAEANLVGTDLLQILATWSPNDANNKSKARIALACFEVMVPLTWPIEKDLETMTVNHHRHLPVLQLAQLGYKRAILNFDAAPILSTAVRAALPSMAMPNGDRSARDQGIIKLVLFFLRNIAMITPPSGIKDGGDETQVSRSVLIDTFSFQDIFLTLLTIASNMGEDFRTEDVIIMDIVFHVVKRVDSRKLFVSQTQLNKISADELTAAMSKEAAMLRSYSKNAPTRHSRFGTMIWVKRESGRVSTVSGQGALLDAATRERKMDSTKTFKAPRRARKEEMEPKDLGPPVTLDERARQQLASFVSEFLDSGFNPLFSHVRKSIDREASHVQHHHQGQFFYLVAWFLEAERMRRRVSQESKRPSAGDEVESFNLVAEVLNQEMIITLNRALNQAHGDKDWRLLTTIMRCFTQILLTVQEMSDSGTEENEEIANNILSRLFYEEATHDAIASIARAYKDQGFEYLDACTELTHTFLRILEAYSKQNVDLQVRSRKRNRRKKKAAKEAGEQDGEEDQGDAEDDSADDERQAEKTTQERKFDFKRFTARFVPQGVVDTFVTFTKYYRDLDDAQLKRAHRYFYRVAFKQEMAVMLYRLDIIHLFHGMIKGPEPLDKSSSMFKEWEELVKQIIKKCVRKLDERPALFAELLFSKINSTAYYLEYGYEKQTVSANPRPGAELEFKREVGRDQQIAIVVGVLLDRNQTDHLEWIKKQLAQTESERRAWENVEKAMEAERTSGEAAAEPAEGDTTRVAPHSTVRPDNDARRTAMFKNPHLRLLMNLAGLERLTPTLDEAPDSTWIIPGTLTADALKEALSLINKAEFTPPTFDDGALAEDQLRRKAAPRKRAAYDDDDDDNDDDVNNHNNHGRNTFNDSASDAENDDNTLFAPGGPTARRRTAEDGQPPRPRKKSRRRRPSREGSHDEPDGDAAAAAERARARARRQRELEKARRIKSAMYVDPLDDLSDGDAEGDAAFFAREAARQAAKDRSFGGLLAEGGPGVADGDGDVWAGLLGGGGGGSDDDDDDDDDDDGGCGGGGVVQGKGGEKGVGKVGKRKSPGSSDDEEDGSESGGDGDSDSSAGSARPVKRAVKRRKPAPTKVVDISSDEDDGRDGDDDGDMDVDPSQSSNRAGEDRAARVSTEKANGAENGREEDTDEDMPVVAVARPRPRARAGFIVESSDEE